MSIRARSSANVTSRGSAGALFVPALEQIEKLRFHAVRRVGVPERTRERQHRLHLLEVGRARWAGFEVRIERRSLLGRQPVTEVLVHELDQLLTKKIDGSFAHRRSASERCCSSQARAFARARCKRTR